MYKLHKPRNIEYVYQSVGTLGDSFGGLTCCMDVVEKWNKAETIHSYEEFEYAAEEVINDAISCMVVPGAYPKIGQFIMDRRLKVLETFVHRIPQLVVAGKREVIPDEVQLVFHHPATAYLLNEIGIRYHATKTVSSNPKACLDLISYSDSAVAITNRNSADFYKLHVYRVLREGIMMPFVCFGKD